MLKVHTLVLLVLKVKGIDTKIDPSWHLYILRRQAFLFVDIFHVHHI